ncbi:pectate lyase [Actinoplanes derwentensis]|uniref:Pectate lyase n=1 Tax=Actinoplanes derwentensis TaxID=113562 RepID=A0A1H2D855_9ACTN|nr:pectate lyase [Actinoplanes derwentensis]GID86256.1 pectate lyase [Actinoplanes derwentensis]SDT78764.1 Pectate lyase [Actinoplanes derwentensis]
MFKKLQKRWRAGLVTVVALSLGMGAVVYTQGASAATFPTATGTTKLTASKAVSGTFDGGLKRFVGSGALGGDSQDEGQDPLFTLADGATLKNVIIGSPAADGVHCLGSCTISNVWWENVGEDAATFKGGSSAKYTVTGGAAKGADDKVFQHNGGGTLTVSNFAVSDFGKLYRSCGNCKTQYKRSVVLKNVTATAPGGSLVGINSNFGDTATLSGITISGDSKKKIAICVTFKGNKTGAEPTKVATQTAATGGDGTNCKFSTSNITYK